MSHKYRKVLLLAGVIILSLYFFANVILNFSTVHIRIKKTVQHVSQAKVSLGFIYLNWNLHPTLHSLRLRKPGTNRNPTVYSAELEGIELVMDLQGLLNIITDQKIELSSRKIVVGNMSVVFDSIQGFSLRDIGTTRNSGSTGPIEIENWNINFRLQDGSSLRFGGTKLKYDIESNQLVTRINKIQDEKALIKADLTLKDKITGEFKVEQFSIPDQIWQLKRDQWTGELVLDTHSGDSAQSNLKVNLRGTPGLIHSQELPEVDVNTRIALSDTVASIRDFKIHSSYLSSNLSGELNLRSGSIGIKGDYNLEVQDLLSQTLDHDRYERFKLTESFPVRGSFDFSGPITSPELSGKLELKNSALSIRTRSDTYSLRLSNWSGTLEQGKVKLTEGYSFIGNSKFSLRKGFLTISEGDLVSSFTGNLELNDLGSPERSPYSIINRVGSLKNADLPLNFSFILGNRSIESALAIKKGRLEFSSGLFRDITLLTSISSKNRKNLPISGHFIGPDGNLFKYSGELFGEIQFRSSLRKIDNWLCGSNGYRRRKFMCSIPAIEFSGLSVSGTFSPYSDNGNKLDLNLIAEKGDFFLIDGSNFKRPLELNLNLNADRVRINKLRLGDKANFARASGLIKFANDKNTSGLDVELITENFALVQFYKALSNKKLPIQSEVNSKLTIQGSPTNPTVDGHISSTKISYFYTNIHDLRAQIVADSNSLILNEIGGTFADGKLNGSFRLRQKDYFESNIHLKGISIGELFSSNSWIKKNLKGSLSSHLDLKGELIDTDSIEGSMQLMGKQIVLREFPKIEGIRKVASEKLLNEEIEIKPVDHRFPISSGKIRVNDLTLKSDDLSLSGEGFVGFGGRLDVSLKLELRGSALRRFLQDVLGNIYREVGLSEETRKLVIPIQLKGRLDNPVFDVNQNEINDEFRRKLIIESLLPEQIGKPIDEILQEIPFFN